MSLRSQLAAGFNSYDSTVNASKLNENSQVKKKKRKNNPDDGSRLRSFYGWVCLVAEILSYIS